MDHEYWLNRWIENRIGFHRPGVNPLLQRFLPGLKIKPGRALVPLCGKTGDLAWLMEQGYEVVSVDLSQLAARAFASEHGIPATMTQEPPFFVMRGPSLTFYIGDFFGITAQRVGLFEFIYDRAALIALPADVRPTYASRLQSLLAPEGGILLIGLEYDSRQMDGPPFSVPEVEVRSLFSECVVEKLHEYDCIEDEPRFKERGVTWMKETVFVISKRAE